MLIHNQASLFSFYVMQEFQGYVLRALETTIALSRMTSPQRCWGQWRCFRPPSGYFLSRPPPPWQSCNQTSQSMGVHIKCKIEVFGDQLCWEISTFVSTWSCSRDLPLTFHISYNSARTSACPPVEWFWANVRDIFEGSSIWSARTSWNTFFS